MMSELPDLSADPELARLALEHAEMLAVEMPAFAERAGCPAAEVERIRSEGQRVAETIRLELERKQRAREAMWN